MSIEELAEIAASQYNLCFEVAGGNYCLLSNSGEHVWTLSIGTALGSLIVSVNSDNFAINHLDRHLLPLQFTVLVNKTEWIACLEAITAKHRTPNPNQ